MKIAGAPISWGVCEVPGWGHQMSAERVLGEMRDLGLAATEFGPDGFLPSAPGECAALLGTYGLAAIGGFVPVVLHRAGHDPVPSLGPVFDRFSATGAGTLVLAADAGTAGYDERPTLDEAAWRTLCANLDRIAAAAAERGLRATLHPHVGTLVESPADVARVLDGSRIPLCLDTGHFFLGGGDPAELARDAARRIAHVHLKDADAALAGKMRSGDAPYSALVAGGMYRPLGHGDVDIAGVIGALESAGYAGWYVMEQDAVLAGEPGRGDGPIRDVRTSVEYLRGLRT